MTFFVVCFVFCPIGVKSFYFDNASIFMSYLPCIVKLALPGLYLRINLQLVMFYCLLMKNTIIGLQNDEVAEV